MASIRVRKNFILVTVIFLVIQIVAISFGQAYVANFSTYMHKQKNQTDSSRSAMFNFLLGAQSLHLENFAADFSAAETDSKLNLNEAQAIEKALKQTAAIFSNLPDNTTIYVANKKTKQMVFPKGATPINLAAENYTNELLFSDENYLRQQYIISLKNEPKMTYEQARDFYLTPLGTANRIFIQKIILPSPIKTSENYVVFAVFEERTLRHIIENPVVESSAEKSLNYLFITFALTLCSTIMFSFYTLLTLVRINCWIPKK